MRFQSHDEASKRMIESAIKVLGEHQRELVVAIYSLGVVDGQIKGLDRAKEIRSEVLELAARSVA